MAVKRATEDTVPCKQCACEISTTAKLCRHCNSYQDWRGRLSVSTTMVALLVALLSVATMAIPPVMAYFHTPASALSITNPVVKGRSIYLIASNRGDATGVVLRAEIASPYFNKDLEGAPDLELRSISDSIVPPGAKQLALDFSLNRNAFDSALASLELAIDRAEVHSLRAARLQVYVAEYDGEQVFYDFALSSEQLLMLLEGHMERCSSLGKDASHRNGCGGLDDMHRELQKKLREVMKKLDGEK